MISEPFSNPSTISTFEAKYIQYLKATRSLSYVRDNGIAFKWLIKIAGDIPLGQIEISDIEQAFALEFARAPHNAARFYRTLKAAFAKAVAWGELNENVLAKFKLARIPETSIPFLKAEELNLLLAQDIPEDLKRLFEFGFYTGMRQGEIINLKWDSLNLEEKIITVRNTDDFTTKSKKQRLIPINDHLMRVISKLILLKNADPTCTYVFQRKGRKLNGNYVARQFKKGIRAARLNERLHLHCLRHSFASNLIRAGVNPVYVKQLMGHSSLSTTLKYMHVGIEDLRAAVSKLS